MEINYTGNKFLNKLVKTLYNNLKKNKRKRNQSIFFSLFGIKKKEEKKWLILFPFWNYFKQFYKNETVKQWYSGIIKLCKQMKHL